MKRVRVNNGTVGFIYKKGDYKKVVTHGLHWLMFGETIEVYDLTKPFAPNTDLNIFLKDETLAKMLTVKEVKDTEIALMFTNSNFTKVLTPGRYAFWNEVMQYSFIVIDLSKKEITENISKNILKRVELASFLRTFIVESYEKGVLFADGKPEKFLEPGVYSFWVNPTVVNVIKADLRVQQLEVSGQELLTKDRATIRVNLFTKYRIVDIEKALLKTKEYEKQLYTIMQLSLREYVGMYSLDELLAKKESVSENILKQVRDIALETGAEIQDCGIKDIILPGDIKEIMNQVLIAEKKAQANIITRREETASTRSLLNTAKLMEDNAMLYKLKEMEYVEKIADKINSITVSGGKLVVEQLKDIFLPK